MVNSTKGKHSHSQGQGMAEFGLALPILLLVVFGLLEVGRALFMYAAVVNASREAVRYATAYGVNESDVLHYQNCAAIKSTAQRVAFLLPLEDDNIVIEYDEIIDPDGTPASGDEYFEEPSDPPTPNIGICDDAADGVADGVDTTINLACGDRVRVTVSVNYEPIVPLVPQLTSQTFESSSARTFLGVIELDVDAPACN